MERPIDVPPRPQALGRTIVVAIPALLLLVALALGQLPFLADDALISLRYADRLLDGHGLTWTDGERVEGYSNLLWILLCSALGAAGVDLIVAARVLGFAAAAATLVALAHTLAARGRSGVPAAVAASCALALSAPFAVWTIGGLETPLAAALLVGALGACYRLLEEPPHLAATWPAGGLLALLCWTRPEGLLVAACVAAGVAVARRGAIAVALRLLALPLLAAAAQLAFRLAYYGAWLPNPVLVKVAPGAARARAGLAYLLDGAAWTAGVWVPAAILAVAAAARPGGSRRRVTLLALVAAGWCAFVVAVGGDVFPARRFFVPLLAIGAAMLGEGLAAIGGRSVALRRGAWILAAAGILGTAIAGVRDPQTIRARKERWEWDGEVVGRLLGRAFASEQPLLAVDAAGTLPYFSRLPALDMLGLADRHIARTRPPDSVPGPLGHDFGDGAYVLAREPDIIVFCGPQGGARPCFRSGRELVRDPLFRERYRLVTLEGREPHAVLAQVWIRAEGRRIGIERSAARVVVPAYFFMATGRSVARPDDRGALAVEIDADSPAGLADLRLGPGRWRVRCVADGKLGIRVRVKSDANLNEASGIDEATFDVPADGRSTVQLLVHSASSTRLRTVEIERIGTPAPNSPTHPPPI